MQNLPYIPIEVLTSSLATCEIMTFKDHSVLRMLNKESQTLINIHTNKIIQTCFKNKHLIMYNSVDNFVDTLKHSYFKYIELERVLDNLKIVQHRKRRDKYAHLLKQSLIYDIDDGLDLSRVQNTLDIFKGLQRYTATTLNHQPYAPTDLNRRVILWATDFIILALRKTSESWLSSDSHYQITNYFQYHAKATGKNGMLLDIISKSGIPYLDFFKILAACCIHTDIRILDLIIENSFWYRTPTKDDTKITNTISLLLNFQSYFEPYNARLRNRVIYMTMEFICSVLERYKDTSIHKPSFIAVCKSKCEMFLQHLEISTDVYFKEKMMTVCLRLLPLCSSFSSL